MAPVTKVTFLQVIREYLAYLQKLGILLGGDPEKVQQHAFLSISITSRLFEYLRLLEQRQSQDKLFHVLTIDQLQVLETQGPLPYLFFLGP